MDSSKRLSQFSPGRVIIYTLCLTIAIGTLLLALPISRMGPIPPLDLLFTATSALCVTGLFTIPLDQFTFFGHVILLLLIQLGGLGLIIMTLFIVYLWADEGFSTKIKAGKLLEIESWHSVHNTIIAAFSMTIIIEFIGMLSVFPFFYKTAPFAKALFYSLFHSVSSFCNAGILLPPYNATIYNLSPIVLITTTALMFAGGFGFVTWYELFYYAKRLYSKQRHKLSLHTRIILWGTATLFSCFSVLFFLLEAGTWLESNGIIMTIVHAIFYSISSKSAGLMFESAQTLSAGTIVLMLILSFIGSSPSSTGSGIKITTFAIWLATIRAAITGRESVEIFERRIEQVQVYKALAIIALSSSWIIITICILTITQGHLFSEPYGFFALFVEAVSAFTTLGISLGITGSLTIIGKFIIMMSMIAGRIGSLTLILALKFRKQRGDTAFSYPKEQVMLS